MSTTWSTKADAILSSGQALHNTGVRNWALSREQALVALDQLQSSGIGVRLTLSNGRGGSGKSRPLLTETTLTQGGIAYPNILRAIEWQD